MFPCCTVLPDQNWKLWPKVLSISRLKYWGSFSAMLCMKCIPSIFLVMWVFPRSLGAICYYRSILSKEKDYFKYWCLMNAHPTFLTLIYFWLSETAILSRGFTPDNFESQNSLKFSLTNIWDILLNFVDCESFFDSNYLDIVALRETTLDVSIDPTNFSVRSYLPLI